MISEALLGTMNPAWVLIAGGLIATIIPSRQLRNLFLLALPIIGFIQLWSLDLGTYDQLTFMGYDLVSTRIDDLARVFATIFLIATALCVIYAWHVKDVLQHGAGMIYAGAALGAVLAGDLITLFVYWEATAISSVFLIWARRTEQSFAVGMRYLIIQVASGVFLLSGAIIFGLKNGHMNFDHFGVDTLADLDLASSLILLAFGIKAAFPLLHNWLQDAYPQATVTGTVFLSSFTTKLAIYTLARGFAGMDALIVIGAIMAAFPIFFAAIENDLRRVLAYALNNQLGFMVVGVGIGTELAINGTAAHAFSHILYKALLFMGVGAVLYRTGTSKASELGGLYKCMPLTTVFTTIGALAMATPLFCGFISKSLILSAAAYEGHWVVWSVLILASAGVFLLAGVKLPYSAFFAQNKELRTKEAPANMLIAMGLTSALCIGVGVYPTALYDILPYAVDYEPYTVAHVITQMQLLFFTVLAFAVLLRFGIYPPNVEAINLDTDWLYRRGGHKLLVSVRNLSFSVYDKFANAVVMAFNKLVSIVENPSQTTGIFARTTAVGNTGLLISCLLMIVLVLSYL